MALWLGAGTHVRHIPLRVLGVVLPNFLVVFQLFLARSFSIEPFLKLALHILLLRLDETFLFVDDIEPFLPVPFLLICIVVVSALLVSASTTVPRTALARIQR